MPPTINTITTKTIRIIFLLFFGFSIVFFSILGLVFLLSCLRLPISSLLKAILFKQPSLVQKLAMALLLYQKQEPLRNPHPQQAAADLAGRMLHSQLYCLFDSQAQAMLLRPKQPITLNFCSF